MLSIVSFVKIYAGKAVVFSGTGRKRNHLHACTMKPYDILQIKNTSVKSVW